MTEFTTYLVDDDELVRRSAAFMLKTSGHTVEEFETGDAFLAKVRHLKPGPILLDVRMPGTDGLAVQTELNSRGVAFPVVFMTGHGDIDMAVKAMKAGACDFVEKPFDKSTILKSLDQALNWLADDGRQYKRRDEALVLINGLTTRERDVLGGLVMGHPNKTIGYDLGISPRTVEIHRANMMVKLGAKHSAEAVRMRIEAQIDGGQITAPIASQQVAA